MNFGSNWLGMCWGLLNRKVEVVGLGRAGQVSGCVSKFHLLVFTN